MAKPTERDLIEEVEELLAKATPGQWWYDGYCYIFARQPDGNCHPMIADFDSDEAYLTRMRGVGAGLVENGQQEANAQLIAAAPDLLRHLVDENKALRAHVVDLNHDMEALNQHCEEYHYERPVE